MPIVIQCCFVNHHYLHISKETCNYVKGALFNCYARVFLMWCAHHHHCIGFFAMREKESAATAFEALFTRFQQPPKWFIFDNACNLKSYVLNREPTHFKHMTTLVDQYHYTNSHNNCCTAFHSKHYACVENSSLAEQKNSKLDLIRIQILYMTQFNFLFFLRHFLYRLNQMEAAKRAALDNEDV